jgi:hypothetical protein
MLMIHPDRPIGIRDLQATLERTYARPGRKANTPAIAVHGRLLELAFPGLTFRVSYDDAPHVIEESSEIAARFGGGRSDQAAIALCASRFFVETEGSDENMKYFNDFVTIVSCAEKAGRVFQFDPVSGTIMTPVPS